MNHIQLFGDVIELMHRTHNKNDTSYIDSVYIADEIGRNANNWANNYESTEYWEARQELNVAAYEVISVYVRREKERGRRNLTLVKHIYSVA